MNVEVTMSPHLIRKPQTSCQLKTARIGIALRVAILKPELNLIFLESSVVRTRARSCLNAEATVSHVDGEYMKP